MKSLIAILLIALVGINTATPVPRNSTNFDYFIHAFFDTLGYDQIDDVAYYLGDEADKINGLFWESWDQFVHNDLSWVNTADAFAKLGRIFKVGAGSIRDVANNTAFLQQFKNVTGDIDSALKNPSAFISKVTENAKANMMQLMWVFNDLRANLVNERFDGVGRRSADLILILTKNAIPRVSSNLRFLSKIDKKTDVLLCVKDISELVTNIYSMASNQKQIDMQELFTIFNGVQTVMKDCGKN